MTPKKEQREAHRLRQERDRNYEEHKAQPTEVNGTMVKSRLEALWIEELSDCESFKCIECVLVPVWIDGPFGRFLSNYKPDLVIETEDGGRILVELKPNHELAMADDRQKRALELNPRMKFVVIGGYPWSQKGVTVRLLSGKKEVVTTNVSISEVKRFLGCKCEDD